MFGVFWLICAIVITVSYGYNAFSEKGISNYEIEVNETEISNVDGYDNYKKQNKKEQSYADMLRELKKLRDDGIISYEEYEIKKNEIMNEKW